MVFLVYLRAKEFDVENRLKVLDARSGIAVAIAMQSEQRVAGWRLPELQFFNDDDRCGNVRFAGRNPAVKAAPHPGVLVRTAVRVATRRVNVLAQKRRRYWWACIVVGPELRKN